MRESIVEKKFAAEVKKRGGLAVKFVSPGFNGVPDRLVLFPGGRMAFVELKDRERQCGLCSSTGQGSLPHWAFVFTPWIIQK